MSLKHLCIIWQILHLFHCSCGKVCKHLVSGYYGNQKVSDFTSPFAAPPPPTLADRVHPATGDVVHTYYHHHLHLVISPLYIQHSPFSHCLVLSIQTHLATHHDIYLRQPAFFSPPSFSSYQPSSTCIRETVLSFS